jgi:hypothetical protein
MSMPLSCTSGWLVSQALDRTHAVSLAVPVRRAAAKQPRASSLAGGTFAVPYHPTGTPFVCSSSHFSSGAK